MEEPIVDSEQRLKICEGCEYFQKRLARCKVCGCFMKIKTKIPFADCPEGKW